MLFHLEYTGDTYMLMVQKSGKNPPNMYETLANNGDIILPYQLVIAGFSSTINNWDARRGQCWNLIALLLADNIAMENHHINRRYIFKWWMFHCYVRLPECIHIVEVLIMVDIVVENGGFLIQRSSCWKMVGYFCWFESRFMFSSWKGWIFFVWFPNRRHSDWPDG